MDTVAFERRDRLLAADTMPNERLTQYRWFWLDAVQLLSIGFAAVMLIPAGAHLFELSHKLQLAPADYMTVQGIYRGWALFGFAVAGSLAIIGLHTFLVRRNKGAFAWSLAAFGCVAAAQIVFWSFTYPMNVLTANWTVAPADFEAARDQWEYSHAAASLLGIAALLTLMRSIEISRPFVSISILESIERDAAVRAARMRALASANGDVDGSRGLQARRSGSGQPLVEPRLA
jgi:hypothetical protein